MTRLGRRLAPLLTLLLVASAVAPVISAGPVAAAMIRPVRLEAGVHTGYTFSASGAILTSKSASLADPLATTSDDRRWIPNRGAFLRVASGPLAGTYVRESMVAFIPGLVVTATFSPAMRVAFPAGTYLGYTFDAGWGLGTTKRATLANASGALAARRGVINGRPYAQIVSGIWTGYWMPITTPTTLSASRISCSVPAKVPAGGQQVFRILPTTERQVALTFDMGGRMDPAVAILERLVLDRVCATVFPTGAAALTTQGRAAMAVIKAHPELFEVGNHTDHHCNLRDGGGGAACPATPPSSAFIARELRDAATVIRDLTGREPAPYWRPPYGAYDSRVLAATTAAGYTKTFMWHIDTIDWRPVSAKPTPGPTAGQIVDKVVSKAVRGSVVLMHLGGYNTFDALPMMVYRLRANGSTPTTVSDILR